MNKRHIPYNPGWLRAYLKEQLRIDVPLGLDLDDDADEWARICNEIPAETWKRLQGAWRRMLHHKNPHWQRPINAHMNETKHLDYEWHRLIRRGYLTEEDALVIAEHHCGMPCYSNPNVRMVLRDLLSMEADRCRKKAKGAPREHGRKLNLVQATSKLLKTRNPEKISEQCKLDVWEVMNLLQEL